MNKSSETYKNLKTVVIINTALTVVENIGFAVAKMWDISVLLGSVWGLGMACIFFYMISVSVPKALSMEDAEMATKVLRQGQGERMVVLAIGIIGAFKIPFLYWPAALIPLLFTRISIFIIGLINNKEE